MIFRRTGNILIGCALLAAPAMANLVTNGGFTTNPGYQVDLVPGQPSANDISGWTAIGPGPDVAWLPSGYAYIPAINSNSFLDFTGAGYSTGAGDAGVTQSVHLAAGAYTLTFDVGSLHGDYSSVFASAGDKTNVVFTNLATGAGYSTWVQETLNFDVATTGNVAISLVGDAAGSYPNSPYIGLDNVDLEAAAPAAATPEPVLVLPGFLFLGAGCLFLRRKMNEKL